MTMLRLRKSIGRSPSRLLLLLIPPVLACFALSPVAQAVRPPPRGGYPNRNTASGDFALFGDDIEVGNDNTAIGFSALYSNLFGSENTAIGVSALFSNTYGIDNTATGIHALYSNTFGLENTATGATALLYNTTGNDNTATGAAALQGNTIGEFNTATGVAALGFNTSGNNNTATGVVALLDNTTGGDNTADGGAALVSNTTGNFNTAIGVNALLSNTTGSLNIGLGFNAGDNLTTGSNNIAIGNPGVANESDTIRIGTQGTHTAAYIAGISGVTIAGGVPVIIDADGHLGSTTSSERFKDEIKPMAKASEAILALKPVTFHYKKELDPDGIPQFGLVAEQVQKVNPDLVARDAEGKVYTVRYEAVNAMLLNEFLKAHRKIEDQQATIAELKSTVAQQQKGLQTVTSRLEQQAAEIQKVSAQLEASKPASQVVNNNH